MMRKKSVTVFTAMQRKNRERAETKMQMEHDSF